VPQDPFSCRRFPLTPAPAGAPVLGG
jgi:hypothetical protein